MQFQSSKLRTRGGLLAATVTCAALTLTGAPAIAAPTAGVLVVAAPGVKLGQVQGLDVAISKPGAAYRLAVTWNPLTNATSYRVALTNAGTVLASRTVTSPEWNPSTTLPAGSTVKIKVTPVAIKRPGTAKTISRVLPDLTAPTGVYRVDQTGAHVDVTEESLSDDVSTTANIVRSVDWGDGAGFVPLASGNTDMHDYAGLGVHYPSVQLTDEAGNTATLPLHVVVVGDTTGPVGQFDISRITASATPNTVWATLTRVRVIQSGLGDDYSAAENVARSVDWNDGTAVVPWTSGTTLDHVFQVAGTYTPVVHLLDEAGNPTTAPLDSVVVREDTAAPRASLRRPATHRRWVASWRKLTGKATDTNGSGVRKATLRIIEKRRTSWFAYRSTTRTWVKAASKPAALRRSRVVSVKPNTLHQWSYRLPGLRKGTLVVRLRALDKVGNASVSKVYRQVLSHR